MKIIVSYAKKIGQPNYGSLGATCGAEIELPDDLTEVDFQARAKTAYAACAEAVDAQLDAATRQPPAPPPQPPAIDAVKKAWWAKGGKVKSMAEAIVFLDAAKCDECAPFREQLLSEFARHMARLKIVLRDHGHKDNGYTSCVSPGEEPTF